MARQRGSFWSYVAGCTAVAVFLLLLPLNASAQPQELSREALVQEAGILNQAIQRITNWRTPGTQAAAKDLLQRRSQVLSDLLSLDPATAIRFALPSGVAEAIGRQSGHGDLIEARGTWDGTINIIIEDDFQRNTSRRRIYLRDGTGTTELVLSDPHSPVHQNERVSISGLKVQQRIAVTAIRSAGVEPGLESCNSMGSQNIAVFTVTTPDYPVLPAIYNPAVLKFYLFDSARDSLNAFWLANSYGRTGATGDVFPIELPNYSCEQPFTQEQFFAAIRGRVDLSRYSHLSFIQPDMKCPPNSVLAWSTLGCVQQATPEGSATMASMQWFWALNYQSASAFSQIVAHELGHGLKMSHANLLGFTDGPLGRLETPGENFEYGDNFSTMGSTWGPTMGSLPKGHYAAPHKASLGWLAPGEFQEVTSSGTFTVAPYESTTGIRALRILRDASTGSWLWIEYRQPLGADYPDPATIFWRTASSNVFAGALVHYESPFTPNPNRSYLLSMAHPMPTWDFWQSGDPALLPGQSWSDPYSPLTLTVNSATKTGLSVTVQYNDGCATIQTPSIVLAQQGGEETVKVLAVDSCSWTIANEAPWITLSGPSPVTGPGLIRFEVSANDEATQRTATIQVGQQSATVVQAGTGLSLTGFGPGSGLGTAGEFTFDFQSPDGFAEKLADIHFGSNDECTVQVDLERRRTNPRDERNCVVVPEATEFRGSSTDLHVTLGLKFENLLVLGGTHRIFVDIQGDNRTRISAGSWTVPRNDAEVPMIMSVVTAGGPGQISQNKWIEIRGSNLAPSGTSDSGVNWSGTSELPAGDLPTELAGVRVLVHGRPANIAKVSPTQIYALSPLDDAIGAVPVQVMREQTASAAFMVTLNPSSPTLLHVGATQYILATHADGRRVGPSSLSSNLYEFAPAHPNERITLYGNGCGLPVPAVPEGSPDPPGQLAETPTIHIGGNAAIVQFAGIISPGLCRIDITVPDLPSGDSIVSISAGGGATSDAGLLTVEQP